MGVKLFSFDFPESPKFANEIERNQSDFGVDDFNGETLLIFLLFDEVENFFLIVGCEEHFILHTLVDGFVHFEALANEIQLLRILIEGFLEFLDLFGVMFGRIESTEQI